MVVHWENKTMSDVKNREQMIQQVKNELEKLREGIFLCYDLKDSVYNRAQKMPYCGC